MDISSLLSLLTTSVPSYFVLGPLVVILISLVVLAAKRASPHIDTPVVPSVAPATPTPVIPVSTPTPVVAPAPVVMPVTPPVPPVAVPITKVATPAPVVAQAPVQTLVTPVAPEVHNAGEVVQVPVAPSRLGKCHVRPRPVCGS